MIRGKKLTDLYEHGERDLSDFEKFKKARRQDTPADPEAPAMPTPPPKREPFKIRATEEILDMVLPVFIEISWDDVEPRVIHCASLEDAFDIVSHYFGDSGEGSL